MVSRLRADFAVVRPGRVVALEEVVGQRRQQEVGGTQVGEHQAGALVAVDVLTQDATDERVHQGLCGGVGHELVEPSLEPGAELRGRGERLLQELARTWSVERGREQVGEQVDLHALRSQLCHERVVLLTGPGRPHDVVEQQLVHVLGSQPRQLEAGPVHDDLVQPADLGVDVERRHGRCPLRCAALAGGAAPIRARDPGRRTGVS